MLLSAFLVPGCAVPSIYSTTSHHPISLSLDDLRQHGIAFITPSMVTGQEEDKQALALTFSDVLKKKRPDIPVTTLSETLGIVNRNGIAEKYKVMYEDYRNTGIFKRETLQAIGQATGNRYLAQLKLADFYQEADTRFGMLGLRLVQTKRASIRLFWQIWDSQNGTIAWEGVHEMNYAYDTAREKNITFRIVVEESASELIARLEC